MISPAPNHLTPPVGGLAEFHYAVRPLFSIKHGGSVSAHESSVVYSDRKDQ